MVNLASVQGTPAHVTITVWADYLPEQNPYYFQLQVHEYAP